MRTGQSLGDALLEALPGLQEQALSRMIDRARVVRRSGSRYDRATRSVTSDEREIYRGPCRISSSGKQLTTLAPSEGPASWGVRSVVLSLPIGGDAYFSSLGVVRHGDPAEVHRGDVLVVLAAPAAPALVGREFVVQERSGGTMVTAHRFVAAEVTP